jgi:hypothetical protein
VSFKPTQTPHITQHSIEIDEGINDDNNEKIHVILTENDDN